MGLVLAPSTETAHPRACDSPPNDELHSFRGKIMKPVRNTTALAVMTFLAACATDQIVGLNPPTNVSLAILASHGFENGTAGPYNGWGVLDYPTDPTSSGMGKVARFRYNGTNTDVNKSMSYTHAIGLGQEIWFQGDFYLATSNLSGSFRKLLYWQGRHDFAKYPNGSGGTSNRVVVLEQDGVFKVDFTHNPGIGRSTHPQTGAAGTGDPIGGGPSRQLTSDDVRVVATLLNPAQGNKWYTVKLRVKFESALGAGNGIVQVWLAERGQALTQRFSKTNALLTDSLWVGADGDYGGMWNGPAAGGQSMDSSDIVFENYEVGNQQQGPGTFDEYRYWDNVAFSTTDDFVVGGTLAEDTFVGTNETQLTSHTPTGTTPGTSWTTAYGEGRDFELENGRVRADQGGYLKRRDVLNKTGGYPDNYKVAATFVFHQQVTADDYFYIGARTGSTGLAGYYFGYETHANNRLFRLLKGDGTSLGTWSYSYPSGGTAVSVELVVNGTTITGRVNGVDRVIASDSQHTSGAPSIYFYGATGPDNFSGPSGIHLDNFIVSSP